MGLYKTIEKNLKEIFCGEEKIFSRKVIFLHVALIVTSFLFVWIFSYSTSFRYDLLGGDSSIFQVVGKYWAQGYMPYAELFEHKGPLLFLINAIGYMIYPRAGVMVPQIICLYASCLFIWRAMEIYSSSAWKIFFMLLSLIFYAAHYQEGNHPSEYSVLFLTTATYFFLRGLKDKNFSCPPYVGFIYGLGFGACLMIRLSDAAQICCEVFLSVIFLLTARDFKTLRKNFLSFCAGFMIIVLPFVIYFAAHSALYEMIFGTLLFNIKYTARDLQQFPLRSYVVYFGVHFMPLFILVALSLWKIFLNRTDRLALSGFFCAAMLFFMLMNFRWFRHYCLIIFPIMPLLFAIICELIPTIKNWFLREKTFRQKFFHRMIVLPLTLILANYVGYCQANYLTPMKFYIAPEDVAEIQKQDLVGKFFLSPKKFKAGFDFSDDKNFSSIEELAELIPDAERNSVVTWGYYCTSPHWVLRTGIKSRERFFMNNGAHFQIDPQIRAEWFGHVRANYPLWILYGVTLEKNPAEDFKPYDVDDELEQLLAEKYSFKGATFIFPQVMKLYRLKE